MTDAWSNWLGQPSYSYIEAEAQGTYSIDHIEWIEIKPFEKRVEGRLIAATVFDHSEEIIKLLDYVEFPYMVTDGTISVYILNTEI